MANKKKPLIEQRVELGKEYRLGSGLWITLDLGHPFQDAIPIIERGQLQAIDFSQSDKGIIRLQGAGGGCTLRALRTMPAAASIKPKSATAG